MALRLRRSNALIDPSAMVGGANTHVLTSKGIGKLPVFQAAATGTFVQQVYTEDGENASGSNVSPNDDTIPQLTGETNIFLSLAITPTDAANLLTIEAILNYSGTTGDSIIGIWQDSTEDAIATGWASPRVQTVFLSVPIRQRRVAGTTSATTFKIGIGPTVSGTIELNGIGGRRMGGTFATHMMITERTP